MENMDLQKAQKQFCESITVDFAQDYFVMGLISGQVGTAYSLTPQHMKRLQQYLTHRLSEYEKVYGIVDAEDWTPGIKSPIQINKEDKK